ncbi:potassium channel family protein [Bacillus alkalisoli]|uniref:potassium channel family protein n=1 Tax=Bacillus alkalisoli TaxID=2011008 RepID=UPI0018E1DEED|nr:potassium channel family protein [Bacillus alkalisoli]
MARRKIRGPYYFDFLHWPLILRILAVIFIINLFFGIVIHFVEPKEFPLIFDGVWWAFVTTATLGYGDYVPITILGRVIAIILILFGTGFVTTYFVSLAAGAIASQTAYTEGKVDYKGSKHIIVIGWNERVRATMEQLKELVSEPMSIVLIDETLKEIPVHHNTIFYIKGNPCHDETLKKANISEAEIVIITADQGKDERLADMGTVLTILAVKGLNPRVYTIAEILTATQVNNAKRAGADEIIQTNLLSSYCMTNSMVSNGMSTTLVNMLDQLKGSKLKYLDVNEEDLQKTFEQMSNFLLQSKILLIGIKRRGETMVNPPLHTKIEEQDRLLVIKD